LNFQARISATLRTQPRHSLCAGLFFLLRCGE
jgi:hypothetical protein